MSSRRVHFVAPLSLSTLVFAALVTLVAPPPSGAIMAQDATPVATQATALPTPFPVGGETTAGTATVTRTPTLTPTTTPTLTMLQARLGVAHAYSAGGEYAKAAEIYAAVALEDRGNEEALTGLDTALKAQAASTATAQAHVPTPQVQATPESVRPPYAATFWQELRDLIAVALAAVGVVLLVYLSARGLRWLLSVVRELWFTRVKRPPVQPGFVIGDFQNATGDDSLQGPQIVGQALTEQLVRWNEAVPAELRQAVRVDALQIAGLGWLRTLWRQVFLPERAFRVSGVLLGKQPGPYRLSVDRLDLRSGAVDASYTFETNADPRGPAQAFRELATTAAFWLRDPAGMQAFPQAMGAPSRAPADQAPGPPGPIQLAGEALKLLAVVRHSIRGAVDYSVQPRSLNDAQGLIERLPEKSSLRQALQSSLDDLRRQVQPGAVDPAKGAGLR